MQKINPFNPNSIVSTNLFAGRKKYLFHIINKLAQVKQGMPSSFFLYGERGIGKTALAKLLKFIAELKDPDLGNLNFLSSYYSVEKNQTLSSVLQASLNELTDKMPGSALSKLASKLGKVFKNGKFSIGGFSLGLEVDSRDEAVVLKDLIISILTNIIMAIKAEDQANKKEGILIIIDEFDNIMSVDVCAQLFRGIVTSLDVKGIGNIAFLLIGYNFTVENFFAGDTSARRQFDAIQLGPMPMSEAKEVLEKGFKEVGVTSESMALESNIIVTGGYPHSIQMIGHNLIEVDKDNNIDEEDWTNAINKTANELKHKDFADMYNFKGKASRKEYILDILAIYGKKLTKKQIAEYCRISNIYQYIPGLIKRGSIKMEDDGDSIRLHSQLFRTAILFHILPKIKDEGYLVDIANKIEAEKDESAV
jgi:Cdc6-like AAA superfamily ATPase